MRAQDKLSTTCSAMMSQKSGLHVVHLCSKLRHYSCYRVLYSLSKGWMRWCLHLVHLHVCVKSDILITRLHGPRGGYSNSKWFQESLMGEKNQALFFFFFNWICCYWLFCTFVDDVPVILKLFSITEPTKAFLILSFGLCHSFYPKCLSPPSGKFLLSSNKPFVLLSNNIPISLITGSGRSVEL